mgnify:CR=1 FL=1
MDAPLAAAVSTGIGRIAIGGTDEAPLDSWMGWSNAKWEGDTLVVEVTGFNGQISWDTTKPDGTAQKLLDVSRINATGWKAKIDVPTGLQSTYQWYLDNIATARN